MSRTVPRSRRRVALLMLAAVLASALMVARPISVEAQANRVLILDAMVTGGINSREAQYVQSLGFEVDVVDDATWSSMTAGQFASYRAIIIGDPTCTTEPSALSAPESNAATWAGAVDGNVIILGNDPVFHYGQSGTQAQQLIEQGIDFALEDPATTGAYITMSCIYHFQAPDTPILSLSGFGSFTSIGAGSLAALDDVRITAVHPALEGLTNEGLSNWGNSVHNVFATYPSGFEVLAIARDPAGNITTPDGTTGYAFFLARGVEPIRAVNLAPDSQERAIGESCSFDVTVALEGEPVADAEVSITVTAGPHAGTTGTVTTDAAGAGAYSYTTATAGTDTVVASWDNNGILLESAEVSCTITGAAPPPTTAPGTPTTTPATPLAPPAAAPARATAAAATFTG